LHIGMFANFDFWLPLFYIYGAFVFVCVRVWWWEYDG